MKTKNIFKDYIITNNLFLAVNTTAPNSKCPFCRGGIHGEKSFSVTRTEQGYLYNCYRASCKAHGYYSTTEVTSEPVRKQEFRARPYSWPCVPLSEVQRSTFAEKFNLTTQEIENAGVLYNPSRDSFAWPIRDCRGFDVATLDRSYSGRRPKSIIYWHNEVPKIYFPRNVELFKHEPVLVVEDIISAIKGVRYVPTIAILGTNISNSDASFLAGMFDSCVMCLDSDAVGHSIRLAKRHSLLFKKSIQVSRLDKDIKDMTSEELDIWQANLKKLYY